MKCPDCCQPLEKKKNIPGDVWICPACGKVWSIYRIKIDETMPIYKVKKRKVRS